jgi:predicted nucleic acid-binding protein
MLPVSQTIQSGNARGGCPTCGIGDRLRTGAERLRASHRCLGVATYIDLDLLDPAALPVIPEITAITMALAVAKDAVVRAARTEKLGAAIVDFVPLPFDGDPATRYGTLVALTLSANRDPRPRRMDLMIAAIASARGLRLYSATRTTSRD